MDLTSERVSFAQTLLIHTVHPGELRGHRVDPRGSLNEKTFFDSFELRKFRGMEFENLRNRNLFQCYTVFINFFVINRNVLIILDRFPFAVGPDPSELQGQSLKFLHVPREMT